MAKIKRGMKIVVTHGPTEGFEGTVSIVHPTGRVSFTIDRIPPGTGPAWRVGDHTMVGPGECKPLNSADPDRRLAEAISNATPPPLRDAMAALVTWVWDKLPEHRSAADDPPYDHHGLMHAAAAEFNLYDDGQNAPLWLSRVVEGVMHDAQEVGERERAV